MNDVSYHKLLGKLPLPLKRRITVDDFNWIDKKINNPKNSFVFIPQGEFGRFSYEFIADIIHDFVMDRKGDQIKTVFNDEYGEIFDDDDLNNHFEIYWEIIPILEDLYKDNLFRFWNSKQK